MASHGTYSKRMQVLAYVLTFAAMCGAIPAFGWVNKILDLHISNDVQTLIVGGLLSLFTDLTRKIFRVPPSEAKASE